MADKTNLTIRALHIEDLSILAEYWYDHVALQAQKHTAIALMPDAEQHWIDAMQVHLQDTQTLAYIAALENEVFGGLIVTVVPNAPGLLPASVGEIVAIVLDMHSPHKRHNTVSQLLDRATTDLAAQGIQALRVSVPAYAPVEQGFWRGLGATHIMDTLWIAL